MGCAVVLVLGLVGFLAIRSGFSYHSPGRKMRIDDIQYFPPGDIVGYSYVPRNRRAKYWCERLFDKLGIKFGPFQRDPVTPIQAAGIGPMLVIYGHIRDEDVNKFTLYADSGDQISVFPEFPTPGFPNQTILFLWTCNTRCPLTNGLYRVRHFGQTNDLAVIRKR